MLRVTAIGPTGVAPLSVYAPVSVVPAASPQLVGWPFCSQLQNRAASPHVTSNIGQSLAAANAEG